MGEDFASGCHDKSLPPIVASMNQYRGDWYSVRVNRGEQSLTYAVNRGEVIEVKSQPNNQESGNQGLGNQGLDKQESSNEASGGQETKT